MPSSRGVQPTNQAQLMASYLGEAVMELVAAPDVTEVYTNARSSQVWVERRGKGRTASAGVELGARRIELFLNLVANQQGETLDPKNEYLKAQLPDALFGGARLLGLLPRVVDRPCFNIRKRPAEVIPLAQYVEDGIISPEQRVLISEAAEEKKNILITGETNTGKTTLVNAILDEMVRVAPGDRFLILEETPELQCRARDCQYLSTTLQLELVDLVALAMWANPTRIMVGEVLDEAAHDLMDAWSTGHPGGAGTVHASTPLGAVRRMARLSNRSGRGKHALLAAETIDRVLLMESRANGWRLREVAAVADDLSPEGDFKVRPLALHPTVSSTMVSSAEMHAAGTASDGSEGLPTAAP